MLQLKILHAATKTWHSQVNTHFFFFFFKQPVCAWVVYSPVIQHFFFFSNLTRFLGSSDVKESACSTGDLSSIPGLGRSPGEESGNPLQCSCRGNPMDRGAWQATPMGLQRVGHDLATKQQTTGLDFNLKSCGQLLPNLHFKCL